MVIIISVYIDYIQFELQKVKGIRLNIIGTQSYFNCAIVNIATIMLSAGLRSGCFIE